MATDRVARVVASKRKRHPELREPVSYHGIRAVCEREGIVIMHGPLPFAGAAISHAGRHVILIDPRKAPRRETYAIAHELGHIWLHAEEEPVIYHMEEPWPDDPREDEAEALATLILQGWTS